MHDICVMTKSQEGYSLFNIIYFNKFKELNLIETIVRDAVLSHGANKVFPCVGKSVG